MDDSPAWLQSADDGGGNRKKIRNQLAVDNQETAMTYCHLDADDLDLYRPIREDPWRMDRVVRAKARAIFLDYGLLEAAAEYLFEHDVPPATAVEWLLK